MHRWRCWVTLSRHLRRWAWDYLALASCGCVVLALWLCFTPLGVGSLGLLGLAVALTGKKHTEGER